jgi:hypothetical protein
MASFMMRVGYSEGFRPGIGGATMTSLIFNQS